MLVSSIKYLSYCSCMYFKIGSQLQRTIIKFITFNKFEQYVGEPVTLSRFIPRILRGKGGRLRNLIPAVLQLQLIIFFILHLFNKTSSIHCNYFSLFYINFLQLQFEFYKNFYVQFAKFLHKKYSFP